MCLIYMAIQKFIIHQGLIASQEAVPQVLKENRFCGAAERLGVISWKKNGKASKQPQKPGRL